MPEEAKFKVGDEVVVIDKDELEQWGIDDDMTFTVTDAEYIEGSKAPHAAQFGTNYDRWAYGVENEDMPDLSFDENQLDHA